MISSVVGDEVVAIEDDFEKRTYEEDELHREFLCFRKFDRVKCYGVLICPFICNPRILNLKRDALNAC